MDVEKNVLMVIAPKDFRDEEYAKPRAALYAAGAKITTASLAEGSCIGMLGSQVHADAALADTVDGAWDIVVFVGGRGAQVYFDDSTAHQLSVNTVRAGKPLAAICAAPSILARAGVLRGVKATAFPDREGDLKAHGAKWTGDPVTLGKTKGGTVVVTANGPSAAFAFGQMLVAVLFDEGSSCELHNLS